MFGFVLLTYFPRSLLCTDSGLPGLLYEHPLMNDLSRLCFEFI